MMLYILFFSPALSITGDWTVWTSPQECHCVIKYNNYAWFGTSGGVVRLDPNSFDCKIYTNLEGIGGLDVISLDTAKGCIWYASSNGYVGYFDGTKWNSVDDLYKNAIVINKMRVFDGYMWLCTSRGLIKSRPVPNTFSIIQFLEFVENIAFLPAQSPTYDVIYHNGYIYVATDAGVAKASISSNLSSPFSWEVLPIAALEEDSLDTTITYLGAYSLTVHRDSLFVGTKFVSGCPSVYKLHGDTLIIFSDLSTREPMLISVNDTLWLTSKWGLYYYDETRGRFRLISYDAPFPSVYGLVDVEGKRFLGGVYGYFIYEDRKIVSHLFNAPLGKNVADITFSGGRVVLTTFGKAFNVYDGKQWRQFDVRLLKKYMSDSVYNLAKPFFQLLMTGAHDFEGRIWLGSYGSGILRFNPDSTVEIWNAKNSSLHTSAPDNDNYPVVARVRVDPFGNVWAACYMSRDNKALKVWPRAKVNNPNGAIGFAYPKALPGISVTDIACSWDKVAIATTDGAAIIVHHGTIEDTLDDEYIILREQLPTAFVRAVTIDSEDRVWFGTDDGLCYYEAGSVVKLTMPADVSGTITSLAADEHGNIWIGTIDGAAVLLREGYYSTFKSTFSESAPPQDRTALISDKLGYTYSEIMLGGVFTDGISGDIWFGFEGGAVVLHSPYAESPVVRPLRIYPNPAVAERGILPTIYIADVPSDAPLLIFDASGQLVRHFESYWKAHDGVFRWDCTNQNGEKVAAGVYTCVAPSENGVAKGKVLIIH